MCGGNKWILRIFYGKIGKIIPQTIRYIRIHTNKFIRAMLPGGDFNLVHSKFVGSKTVFTKIDMGY